MRWMTVTTIVLCVVNLARCRQSKPDSVIDALGGAVEAPAPDLSLVVHSVAFSPSGKELAVGRDDGAVAVFAVASGELVRSFSESAARVRAVAFSPDGNLIASGGEDHTIRLWMVSTPVRRWSISSARTGPGGRLLVVVARRERALILQFA